MTFDHLRQLLAIISEAIDTIQSIYLQSSADPYASPPPSPSYPHPQRSSQCPLDFPSIDAPYDKSSPAEARASDPLVVTAITRIVAACGQMAATVQNPFLSLCDASMAYHLPSCLRLLEASHTVEILRSAGSAGMHVDSIANRVGMDPSKLGHILRLLATHHITREVAPNVFANNRISSMLDTGKDPHHLIISTQGKYDDTNGVAAFVGMCTDELFKSSAYLTEAYLLSPDTRLSRDPTHTPFNFAFATRKGFFSWLEEGATDQRDLVSLKAAKSNSSPRDNKTFRLDRFGKAMTGTGSWEAPGAILGGFDWDALSPGSIVVDVGGGIGSTAMFLATRFDNLRFVIQDRAVVVVMGETAWRARCPDMLDSGRARFQVHDFFTPQPVLDAAVFLLRVVLHDWPDAFARRILLRLRKAAKEDTRLVIADFVLPHACADDFPSRKVCESEDGDHADAIAGVEGVERMLAQPPLLANLGKGSAQGYWMDLSMQVMFNSQERTLREIIALTASAGWKVSRVTRAAGSLFAHIVAVPVAIPNRYLGMVEGTKTAEMEKVATEPKPGPEEARTCTGPCGDIGVGVASSRCGTPTFGSRTDLPSFGEAFARFEGDTGRGKLRGPITGIRSRFGANSLTAATGSVGIGGVGVDRPTIISKPAKRVPSSLTLRSQTMPLSNSEGSSSLPSPSSPVPKTPPAHQRTPSNMRTPKQMSNTPRRTLGSPPTSVPPRRATGLPVSPRQLWDAEGGLKVGAGMSRLVTQERKGRFVRELMQSHGGFSDACREAEGGGTRQSGGTVLAAAAKIERGLKKVPSP